MMLYFMYSRLISIHKAKHEQFIRIFGVQKMTENDEQTLNQPQRVHYIHMNKYLLFW